VKFILKVLSAVRDFLWRATKNPVSATGVALTTLASISFLAILAIEIAGVPIGNYAGIVSYLILPAIFVLGLALIPIGLRLQRRKEQKAGKPGRFPVLDFNDPRLRSVALLVLVLTVVNLMIVSTASFKGVEVMDSTQFCGGTCHTVMTPEFTTYQRSPHSRVKCTECHIGSGANWFVKSKLSGSWQVVSVALNLYPRPIPAPLEDLRPARETCEQCHWPTKFVGERLRFFNRFAEDEKQTEKKTVLLMKTGGGETGRAHGIHWHVDPDLMIRYRSDKSRQKIFDIELTGPTASRRCTSSTARSLTGPSRGGGRWTVWIVTIVRPMSTKCPRTSWTPFSHLGSWTSRSPSSNARGSRPSSKPIHHTLMPKRAFTRR
jgi:hypothetical protein